MFYEISGERFREVFKCEDGSWLVSFDHPLEPRFVIKEDMERLTRILPPAEYVRNKEKEPTAGQKKRLALLEGIVDDPECIMDRDKRNEKIRESAKENHTTVRRLQMLYYRALAGRPLVEERVLPPKEETLEQKNFSWAIEEFYFSAKKMSLKSAYDLMLLSRYTDQDGHLMDCAPSWYSFRHFFYGKNYHRKSRNTIARNGLSDYQRNKRPLFGSACEWKNRIGAYQMDATQADIYLVSRLDRKAVIGRPNIYLAVDTATQLIAGVYVGLEAGESAFIKCLANAAMDKVAFCRSFGIEIDKDKWPSEGLPGEIITDKGREFIGSRMEELAMKYGIEFESLPPFRPDGKGLVEKAFDLIQQKYKPLLRGKGVIEPDAQERWAVDYRSQAALTLEEFTKVVIHCVLYLNSSRMIENCRNKDTEPTAAALWMWQEQQGKSMMVPIAAEELYLFGLPRKTITLSRKGIHHQGLMYVSADCKRLLEKTKASGKFQIAYDPEDVSRVYLVDGMEYHTFQLAEAYRQYAGATESEYQMEREQHKGSIREAKRKDTEGRLKMIRDIQKIVGRTECIGKDTIGQESIQKNRRRELA